MNVHFRASFGRDLKKISNKDILKHVRETIEQIERAATLVFVRCLDRKEIYRYFP